MKRKRRDSTLDYKMEEGYCLISTQETSNTMEYNIFLPNIYTQDISYFNLSTTFKLFIQIVCFGSHDREHEDFPNFLPIGSFPPTRS